MFGFNFRSCVGYYSTMFYDEPGMVYENPPPPLDYELDLESDPVFIYPRPQRISNFAFLTVDWSLIHKDLITLKENNSSNNEAGKEIATNNESIETVKNVTTKEPNAEVSLSISNSEKDINKTEASKEKALKENSLKKTKIKCEPSIESTVVVVEKEEPKQKNSPQKDNRAHVDKSKKKSIPCAKTPSLESISKSPNIDSEGEKRKISKSPSHREKTCSKKSSGQRRKNNASENTSLKDKVPYDKVELIREKLCANQEKISSDESIISSLSKKTAISVDDELLSDKDGSDKDKIKSSDGSRKKHSSNSRKRFEDDRSTRKKHYDRSSSDDSRKMYSNEDKKSKFNEDSHHKSSIKRKVKQESEIAMNYSLDEFFCDVCSLTLNSELTYSTHMAGKRHKKAVRMKNEQKLTELQILDIEDSMSCNRVPDVGCIQLKNEKSKIQEMCDNSKLLILGLDYLQEIRGYENTKYFCELCSAHCVPNSIVQHLIGFRHHVSCIKQYCPDSYDLVKDADRRDKRTDLRMRYDIKKIMHTFGRGRIRVFKDTKRSLNPSLPRDLHQPSTSWQDLDAPIKKADESVVLAVTDKDCLSRDFSDFYCKVCDTHMNNHSMWESHARGKRHIKNKKKASEGLAPEGSYIPAPRNTISHLEEMIHRDCYPNDIIVGLSFIKENQGENGDLYNCYLCGSVSSTVDIIDHLYLLKHKTKYLEKMHLDKYHNSVDNISVMPIGEKAKEALIDEECRRILKILGPGRPQIVMAKQTFQ